jgi:hypothetical protein
VGLASSQDGLKWVKQNKGQPVFLGGAAGEWDSGGALRRCVTRIDGVQHMFYEGVVSACAYFFSAEHRDSSAASNVCTVCMHSDQASIGLMR